MPSKISHYLLSILCIGCQQQGVILCKFSFARSFESIVLIINIILLFSTLCSKQAEKQAVSAVRRTEITACLIFYSSVGFS